MIFNISIPGIALTGQYGSSMSVNGLNIEKSKRKLKCHKIILKT